MSNTITTDNSRPSSTNGNRYDDNMKIYNKYLNTAKTKSPRTFDTTYKNYLANMLIFFDWVNIHYPDFYLIDREGVKDIVPILEDFISYLQLERNNNSRSINGKLAALSSFYIWATKRNLVDGHPFRNKLDKIKMGGDDVRESYFLTDDEINKINAELKRRIEENGKEADKKKYLLWRVFLDTAGRRRAVLSIKVKNVNLSNGLIQDIIEKGGKKVDFIITAETSELLKEHIEKYQLEKDDFVFFNWDKSDHMDYGTVSSWVRDIGNIVGIPKFYPHSIRKTRINQICDKHGLDIASTYANHKTTKVTKDHYVKPKTAADLRNLILSTKKK